MKLRIIAVILVILIALFVLPINGLTAEGDTGTEGDFSWRELADGTVEVTGYSGAGGYVTIPETLNGKVVSSIGYHAISYNYSITGLTIQEGVKSVERFAFFYCTGISSLTLPESLQSISGYAFGGTGITSVTIPQNVSIIEDQAFQFCYNLSQYNVDISNVSYSSENGVLYNKDKTTLIAYPANKDGAFSIPSSVVSIGVNAFFDCNLTNIDIPTSVLNIDKSFNNVIEISGPPNGGSSQLQNITVSSENPNYYAADGILYNKNMTSLLQCPAKIEGTVIIPDGVTEIETMAFGGCHSLESVIIPDSVNIIGESVFAICGNLSNVDLPSGISRLEYYLFYNSAITHINIPDSVTSIGDFAFRWSDIQSVTIPASVTSMGWSFLEAFELEKVYFLDSPPYADEDTFRFNSDDFTIYYAEDAEGWTNPYYGNPAQAFNPSETHTVTYNINGATSGSAPVDPGIYYFDDYPIVIGEGDLLKSGYIFVGWNTAADGSGECYYEDDTFEMGIGDVILYAQWQEDGGDYGKDTIATAYSLGLDEVCFDAIDYEGDFDFYTFTPNASGSYQIETIGGTDTYGYLYNYTTEEGDLENQLITENDNSEGLNFMLSADLIAGNTYIVKVRGCSSTTVGEYAITATVGVSLWTDSNGVTWSYEVLNETDCTILGCSYVNGVLDIPAFINGLHSVSIGVNAFFDQADIIEITIPNSVTSIGDNAFYRCEALTSVTIQDSVVYIGTNVFGSCNSLTSITVADSNANYASVDGVLFDKSVTTILQCPAGNVRTTYEIPNSVTTVGQSSFCECSNLTSIIIPNGVLNIEIAAFIYCSGLTSIIIPNSVISIEFGAFSACDELSNIKVADGNAYFKSIDGILFDVLGTDLIQYPAGKTEASYIVPNGVINIGDLAFYHCERLVNVEMPDSVTNIGQSAFNGCSSLGTFKVPKSVTSIGFAAFRSCSSLTKITMPSSVVSIGNLVFDGATNVVIYCENGSIAHTYAIDNSIPYVVWTDTVSEGVLTRTYLNDQGFTEMVVEYNGADDSTGIYKVTYYLDGEAQLDLEFDGEGNISGVDTNSDGTTDMLDLVNVAQQYKETESIYDLNADEIINLFDLIIVARQID